MIVHETKDGKNVIKELVIIPADSDLSTGGSGSDFLPNGNPAPAIAQPDQTQPLTPNPQPAELAEGDSAQQPVPGNDGQQTNN